MSNKTKQSFEEEILGAARHSLVKLFREGGFVMPDYTNRLKVPPDLVQRVYALVNYDAVIDALAPKINEMVADRIAAALAQELTTDVKRVLAHQPTRDRLRAAVMGVLDKDGVR